MPKKYPARHMNHHNLERELKYLVRGSTQGLLDTVIRLLEADRFQLVERLSKMKSEEYFDDENFSYKARGDVLRRSQHKSAEGTYSHFMFKQNISESSNPYVSKIEIGSGEFDSVKSFAAAAGLPDTVQDTPVLRADVRRTNAVVERHDKRLLICVDSVTYTSSSGSVLASDTMLEVEDWTLPNQFYANEFTDEHLLAADRALISELNETLARTTLSKYARGMNLLSQPRHRWSSLD